MAANQRGCTWMADLKHSTSAQSLGWSVQIIWNQTSNESMTYMPLARPLDCLRSCRWRKNMSRVAGIAMLLAGVAGFALAGNQRVPEIDAASGAAALSLIAGGLLVLRARRKKS
jgi:hypothetical protein